MLSKYRGLHALRIRKERLSERVGALHFYFESLLHTQQPYKELFVEGIYPFGYH